MYKMCVCNRQVQALVLECVDVRMRVWSRIHKGNWQSPELNKLLLVMRYSFFLSL